MYVELDHALVPRAVEDINETTKLPGNKDKIKKYEVKEGNIQNVFLAFEINKLVRKAEADERMKKYGYNFDNNAPQEKQFHEENHKIDVNTCEPVVGPSEEVFYDDDFGFFSAIMACYNNHWVLRTSPDDW